MDIAKIIDKLQSNFPEGPPTEEQVRGQEVQFLANQWLKRLPAELEAPDFLAPGARLSVDRQEIFDLASEVRSPEDCLELFIWVLGWGTGTQARSIGRSAPALHDPNLKERLWRSFSTVQDLGAVEAYRRLYSWDDHRVKYFGPAFFTKWMYFVAYDFWDNSSPAPLILDKWAAKALDWPTTGWSSSRYGQYLDIAEQIREAWASDMSAHVVEYALFRIRD